MVFETIRKKLLSESDLNYKIFTEKLIPNTYNIIGVKIPVIRKIYKEIEKKDYHKYLFVTEKLYHEEIIIRGLIVSNLCETKDDFILYINEELKFINNWALCDTLVSNLKNIKKYKNDLIPYLSTLLKSNNEFHKRFVFVILLNYYIEDKYINTIFKFINNKNSSDYYVNMSVAWLIQKCFVYHKEKTIKFLKSTDLDSFTLNKAKQKILDSYLVDKETKNQIKRRSLFC